MKKITIEVKYTQPGDVTDITDMFSNGGFIAKHASIRYNTKSTFGNDFPLIIEGKINEKPAIIKISGVACGFIGTITYSTLAILVGLGFNLSADDIMTCNKATPDGWINLHYEK